MTNRRALHSFVAVAGLAVLVSTSLADTRMELQVSPSGLETWSSSLQASAGDSIDIRVRVSYLGGVVTPIGLASTIFQPTVSHWRPGLDVMGPLVNGGVGGQYTTPIGAVEDLPGHFGRVIPFAAVGMGTTNFLKGHVNTVSGVSYLRIAQSQTTNWFGGAGNTSGGNGVNCFQWNREFEPARQNYPEPPFNPGLTGLVVFKFRITLDAGNFDVRTMLVDAPLVGQNQYPNPYVGWYVDPTEPTSSLREAPQILSATIHVNVPAPGVMSVLAVLGFTAIRRRRRG